jgi:voltage-gated potassium channel Kch
LGQSIAFHLPKDDLLIIDFDPEIISRLRKYGFDYIFGDIGDMEIFERANFNEARLIISTSPDFEDNLTLLSELNLLKNKDKIKVIIRAQDEKEAEILYNPPAGRGVDYVLLPYFTSGQYLGRSIVVDPSLQILEQLKNKDLEMMAKVNHQV